MLELVLLYMAASYMIVKFGESRDLFAMINQGLKNLKEAMVLWPLNLCENVISDFQVSGIPSLVVWAFFGLALARQFVWPWWSMFIYLGVTIIWIVILFVWIFTGWGDSFAPDHD